MVKLTILFKRNPAQQRTTFEEHYNAHLALIEQLPHIIRRQAGLVLGSPAGGSPYMRLLELYFDNFDQLDQALISAPGREAGSYLMKHFGQHVELLFAEVFEE